MKGRRLVAGQLLIYILNFPQLPVREDVVLESLRCTRASGLEPRAVLTYYDENNFRARYAIPSEDFIVKKIGIAPRGYPFAIVANAVEDLDEEAKALVTPSTSEIRLAEVGDNTEKLQRTLYRKANLPTDLMLEYSFHMFRV